MESPQTSNAVIYERVTDPSTGVLSVVRARLLAEFTPPFVIGLRDAVATIRKRWLVNYAFKVLRLALRWRRIHGWCVINPAQGGPPFPRCAGSEWLGGQEQLAPLPAPVFRHLTRALLS